MPPPRQPGYAVDSHGWGGGAGSVPAWQPTLGRGFKDRQLSRADARLLLSTVVVLTLAVAAGQPAQQPASNTSACSVACLQSTLLAADWGAPCFVQGCGSKILVAVLTGLGSLVAKTVFDALRRRCQYENSRAQQKAAELLDMTRPSRFMEANGMPSELLQNLPDDILLELDRNAREHKRTKDREDVLAAISREVNGRPPPGCTTPRMELSMKLTHEVQAAAEKGDLSTLQRLIGTGRGVHPDARNDRGTTALMKAADRGQVEAVVWLLEQGADPNLQNDWKSTALHFAAEFGHARVAAELARHGVDTSLTDNRDRTGVQHAEWMGHDGAIIAGLQEGVLMRNPITFTADSLATMSYRDLQRLCARNTR
jgi:hypothetical protein